MFILIIIIILFFVVEQSSPSSHRHLDADASSEENPHAKRSHSCTPLLEVEGGRKDRRRSSSVHTLLQIRRDSAKISEELANLTAQLSAARNAANGSSKRPSLSVPGTSHSPDEQKTSSNQLMAESHVQPSIHLSSSYLKVEGNVNPIRGRS